MEINTNISTKGINQSIPTKRPVSSKSAVDGTSFHDSEALENSLKTLPESRPAAVERARQLISDVQYPPQETIRKISHLLAIHLEAAGN